jgi:TatA/E family protein of Tat protein translocase
MFNLGFSEIIIIGVLALILIGPKQLPEVAKVMGRLIKDFKQATKDLSGGLLDVKEELKKPMQESFEAIAQIENELYKQHGTIVEELDELAEKTEKIELADDHKKTDS